MMNYCVFYVFLCSAAQIACADYESTVFSGSQLNDARDRTIAEEKKDSTPHGTVDQHEQKPDSQDPTRKIMRDFMKINVTGDGIKQKIFGRMDANGDGVVTVKEGLKYIADKVIGVFKPGSPNPPPSSPNSDHSNANPPPSNGARF